MDTNIFKFKYFNILGAMFLVAESFYLDVFEFPNLKIEDFNILGHDSSILKALNLRFLDPKTSIL